MFHDEENIPPFQVYPIESFYLPNKFEKMFNKNNSVIKFSLDQPRNKLTLPSQFSLSPNFDRQITR